MILTRRPDWRSRLALYVSACRKRAFTYGAFDCALFANGAVLAETGVDLRATLDGAYTTDRGRRALPAPQRPRSSRRRRGAFPAGDRRRRRPARRHRRARDAGRRGAGRGRRAHISRRPRRHRPDRPAAHRTLSPPSKSEPMPPVAALIGAAATAVGASLGVAVGAPLVGTGFLASVTASAFWVQAFTQIAVGVALSAIARALAPTPGRSVAGVKNACSSARRSRRRSSSGATPPPATWSTPTPPATITTIYCMVIELSDCPAQLNRVMVGGEWVTLGTPATPMGAPVLEYRSEGKDYLWIRFYDGTQTTADRSPRLGVRQRRAPPLPERHGRPRRGVCHRLGAVQPEGPQRPAGVPVRARRDAALRPAPGQLASAAPAASAGTTRAPGRASATPPTPTPRSRSTT